MAWEIGDPVTRHVHCFVAKNRFLQTPRLLNSLIITYTPFLRAAFKCGRRVHFALRRKMLKPPIARFPAI